MKNFKTRETKKDIKTLDKSRVFAERINNAASRTKEKAEQSISANENSPGEYASDRTEQAIMRVKDKAIYEFNKQGQKGLEETKQNIVKMKNYIHNRRNDGSYSKTSYSSSTKSTKYPFSKQIKTLEYGEKTIKQSNRSTGKTTVKTAGKQIIKTSQKSVKTVEKTSKAAIKTAQQSAKAAQKTAQTTVNASQRASQAARAAAKVATTTIKATAKATVAAVKAIMVGTKALVAAIAAGGWVAVVVIVVICLIALIVSSCFGILLTGEDTVSDMTLQQVVREINEDYQEKLESIKANNPYDDLIITCTRSAWPEVLSVYAVKTTTDPDNPQEVATMTEEKKQTLTDIFWEMNEIEYYTAMYTETEIIESYDDKGNIMKEKIEVSKTTLYITVKHKTAGEMALKYNFNVNQIELLRELLADDNISLWTALNTMESDSCGTHPE